MKNNWTKYIFVFFITCGLFITALYLSNYFNNKKIENLKSIQDKISIDILSSETQFSLLEESSCSDISGSYLSSELLSLGDKIESSEENIGSNEDVATLKRYYSLLEIKDYLLMKRISERCKQASVFVLYFYGNKTNCSDCDRQSYVLTALREKYPGLRVYSFDYNIDISAVQTLKSIYKVGDALPALVMNGKAYNGFQSIEDIEQNLPELQTLLRQEEKPAEEQSKASTTTTTKKSKAKDTPKIETPKEETNTDETTPDVSTGTSGETTTAGSEAGQ